VGTTIIDEKHTDDYDAHPLGINGPVLAAILVHLKAFGAGALDPEPPILEAFVAEATVKG
jgi:hypothetical protein